MHEQTNTFTTEFILPTMVSPGLKSAFFMCGCAASWPQHCSDRLCTDVDPSLSEVLWILSAAILKSCNGNPFEDSGGNNGNVGQVKDFDNQVRSGS